ARPGPPGRLARRRRTARVATLDPHGRPRAGPPGRFAHRRPDGGPRPRRAVPEGRRSAATADGRRPDHVFVSVAPDVTRGRDISQHRLTVLSPALRWSG